jgi:hypothetical protein
MINEATGASGDYGLIVSRSKDPAGLPSITSSDDGDRGLAGQGPRAFDASYLGAAGVEVVPATTDELAATGPSALKEPGHDALRHADLTIDSGQSRRHRPENRGFYPERTGGACFPATRSAREVKESPDDRAVRRRPSLRGDPWHPWSNRIYFVAEVMPGNFI